MKMRAVLHAQSTGAIVGDMDLGYVPFIGMQLSTYSTHPGFHCSILVTVTKVIGHDNNLLTIYGDVARR
ncbi:hypothetical protein D3C81_1144290 [compost metagenome]